MGWTPEHLAKHPRVNSLLGVNTKSQTEARKIAPPPPEKSPLIGNHPAGDPPAGAEGERRVHFTVVCDPMGKPRMTQRDTWAKRPVVLRYRDYCDHLREAAPNGIQEADVIAVDVCAYIAMPASWSEKKKKSLCYQRHRQKPDWDNIGKAVCDALWKDDSILSDGRVRKFWCPEGQQRLDITVEYLQ